MRTYTSSRKHDAACAKSFGRRICSAVLAVIFAFAAISFVGCKQNINSETPPDNNLQTCFDVPPIQSASKLIGTWESQSGEVFEITTDYFKNGGSWGESYAGNNLHISEFEDGYGYIYFVYTKAMDEKYVCSETAPDVGNWYCVVYKKLSASGISFSGAYKADGKTSVATLEEAVAEFTNDNGYFGFYSECVKIK